MGLLTAFSKRLRIQTNSFPLPIGEITITFNDVACLLHLPIGGKLLFCENLSEEEGDRIFSRLSWIKPR